MKKIIPILIVGVLFISGLGAVAISDGEIKEKLTLSFSQLSLQERDNRIILELEGANSVLMKKDHYVVPTCIQTFTYPFGTEIKSVKCIPKNIQSQTITKELMIAPEPVLAGQMVLNEQSKETKSANPKSPNTWYEYDVGVGLINRNERCTIVKVRVFPVQYDQSEQMIEWAKTIEVEIEYEAPEVPISFDDEYIFVVLGPASYSDELNDLIQHKNNRGISTIFVSLDDVYNGIHFPVQGRDNQEKIKYFIKNAIENWDTSYILLVGGSSQCPTRDTHIFVDAQPNPDEEIFVSDLYYADIYDESMAFATWDTNENSVFGEYNWGAQHNYDDVDLYPDVHLGRLACVNGNEVTTSVDKIINYETTRAYTKDWFTDLVVMGGDSFSGDSQHVDEGEYVNDAVIDIMDGFIPDRIWASNGRLNGLVPTGVTEIKNAINDGAGFVDFSGHGNTAVWATHPHESPTWIPTPTGGFYNTHIATLTNGNKLPIVVIGACSVSKFKSDPDCFSWSFVSNSNGGAIGTFGATGLGWAYIGSGVTQGLIEGISLNTFEAYREEGAMTFGEMWSTSITNYIFPGMDDVDYKTIEEWEPLGDPTLAVAEDSQPPEKAATPDGETEGKVGTEYTYTSSTTDPDGDQLYYLFDWGDGTYSGWVGPYNSGETAEASHTWTEQGNYEIKVKAKDENGVQGEWSDPLPIIMPVNYNFFHSLLWEILERLMERFPFLEQIFESMPILSMLLDL